MAKLSKDESREGIAAKVDAAQAVLAAEVASLVSGEDWRRYLGFQTKLHAYSANNAMLIAAQHSRAYADGRVPVPEPSWVAGFSTWRTLGRSVEKGQRGYAVLAPIRRTRRSAVDAGGNTRPLQRDDELVTGEIEQRNLVLRGFKVEYVFDASQTYGADLPVSPSPRLLEGQAPVGLCEAVRQLIAERGFRVQTVPDAAELHGANGQTRWDTRTVVVRSDMDDAAVVKTLIHDLLTALVVSVASTTWETRAGAFGSPEWKENDKCNRAWSVPVLAMSGLW
jgi:N-terminal domain of anti-restriction factor ArdC